jgi:hypothetical protein
MVNGGTAVAVASIVTTVALTVPTMAFAQRAKVGVVSAVEGMVTVTRQAAESRSLGLNDDVRLHDRIVTFSESGVLIQFAANTVTTISQRSAVMISEENGNPVLHLERGTLNHRWLRGGNRQDDALSILTPNATARAAGAIFVITDASDAAVETRVCVVEGSGFAGVLGGAEIEVPERHCVTISGSVLGPVLPMTKPGSGLLSGEGLSAPASPHLPGHAKSPLTL